MTARLIAFQQRVNQADSNIALDDFRAFMPTHSYIFIPTRQMWTASSQMAARELKRFAQRE
jgi:hypothetical protein